VLETLSPKNSCITPSPLNADIKRIYIRKFKKAASCFGRYFQTSKQLGTTSMVQAKKNELKQKIRFYFLKSY
jgi:hypothetical protein